MTKEEAFQKAKFIMLNAMVNHLRTDSVSNAIARFGTLNLEINAIGNIEEVERKVDELIKELKHIKAFAKYAKQVIRNAE